MLFVADFGNRSRFYTKNIRQYMTDEYCYHRLYNARSYFVCDSICCNFSASAVSFAGDTKNF